MTEHPRDCCQVCGGKRGGGGEDVVHYLKSKFNSYHHWKHMACYASEVRAAEREACAEFIEKLAQHPDFADAAPAIAKLIRER